MPFFLLLSHQQSFPPSAPLPLMSRIYSSKEEANSIPPDVIDDCSLCLTICGQLQHRALRLIDPHTNTPLECVTFEPTYYDTETTRYYT